MYTCIYVGYLSVFAFGEWSFGVSNVSCFYSREAAHAYGRLLLYFTNNRFKLT